MWKKRALGKGVFLLGEWKWREEGEEEVQKWKKKKAL
jgi:hypothetical protein